MQEPITTGLSKLFEVDGTPTAQFRDLLNRLGYTIPLTGTGTPEGVVEAFQFSEYTDDAGTAGNIKYVKRDTDISGDKSKGWILV